MAAYNECTEQCKIGLGLFLGFIGLALCEELGSGIPAGWFLTLLTAAEALCILLLAWTGLRAIYPEYLCPGYPVEGDDGLNS